MPCRTAQKLLRKVSCLKLVEFCPSHHSPAHPPPFRASNLSFFSLSPFFSSQVSRETELYTGMSASASASSTALPLAVSSWGFYFSFETPRGCLWRSASSPTTAGRAAPGRGSEERRSSRQRSEVSYFQMTFLKRTGESLFKALLLFDVQKRVYSYIKPISPPSSPFSFDPPTYLALH